MRCTYCMPAEGLPAIPRERLLSADELVRLVGIAVHRLGVCEVRFTGGEPLMRRDLEDIIEGCTRVAPHVPLAITSNAVGLEHRAQGLARAGLTRINISLDTVDRAHFAALTRRDRLDSVLAGIRAAKRHIGRVKVNAVLMRENLDGAADLLRWCLDEGVELRFIEEMPPPTPTRRGPASRWFRHRNYWMYWVRGSRSPKPGVRTRRLPPSDGSSTADRRRWASSRR
ncbi:Probable molybdopterin cofactor synthesis protein A [Gordonia paraffinivorans]|uniref:Probable molybdopterin cofactor synthesis protein A n=1 Tax=Gordonia paraffinivorans TaxID=175628 RepID=A0ABD7V6M7_9ACTN|nr:Probable molybdopterin cofactor synthesis protein A [Gordonia paraffinivorans]